MSETGKPIHKMGTHFHLIKDTDSMGKKVFKTGHTTRDTPSVNRGHRLSRKKVSETWKTSSRDPGHPLN